MENQHRHIAGYRDLSQQEIDLMNQIKTHGESCRALIAQLREMPAGGIEADRRWLSIGETHLQQGFMALTRAVAKPTTF